MADGLPDKGVLELKKNRMSYRNLILEKAYHPLRFLRSVGRSFGMVPAHSLRILNYHDIPETNQKKFAEQLRWLAQSYTFVTPWQFAAMISGDAPIVGHNLMISFDDGFLSNRVVAEEVLDPMGISALFFIVSDFADIKDKKESREFIAKNIYYELSVESLPENWSNMGWSDLEILLDHGHMIGAHTKTHKKLSSINSEEELKREVIGSADTLANKLGVDIDHFAFPFGNLASFSEMALQTAKSRFKYVHSGLRGNNSDADMTSYTIRRDAAALQHPGTNIYSVYSNELLGSFLEGVADYHYAASRNELLLWDKHTN